jgi:uncharacterized protein (DUF849 family)
MGRILPQGNSFSPARGRLIHTVGATGLTSTAAIEEMRQSFRVQQEHLETFRRLSRNVALEQQLEAATRILDLAGFYLDEQALSRARARGRLHTWLRGAGDVLKQLATRTRDIHRTILQFGSRASDDQCA